MSKVFICIHGLGNKPSPDVLTEWWSKSIRKGLHRIGKNIFNPDIIMSYWADVMHEKPLNESEADNDYPYFIVDKYTPSRKNYIDTKNSLRKKIHHYVEKKIDNILLNDSVSNNFPFIPDLIVRRYFKEFEIYYSRNVIDSMGVQRPVKDIIREKVAAVIRKHQKDQILLIAHSMGSIIAYEVLTFMLPEINIDTLITIGSPLGVPLVRNKIISEQNLTNQKNVKLQTPPGIKRNWYNFSDPEDSVAIDHNLEDDYEQNSYGVKPIDKIVNNSFDANGRINPHKSYGYLRTPELAGVIYEFLMRDKRKLTMKILDAMNYLYSKIIMANQNDEDRRS